MQAPVVLFVYNRTDHTKQVIEALSHNDGASDTEVFIYSDAAADETEEGNVRQVRQYLEEVQRQTWFKNVSIILAEQNKGLEKSIIEGVTNIMNRYGRAIVLEDDIVTAPDFLNFMNQALDYYEDDEKIWSISGYTVNSSRVAKGKRDVYIGYRGECWGWASWKNRWVKVDWIVSDYSQFSKNKKQRRSFNKGGRDLANMLKLQQEGHIKSWAIRWCYQQYKEGMFTIFPKYSKIRNIGFDGSGTNCSEQNVGQTNFHVENRWNFVYKSNDWLVSNEFRKHYYKSYIRQFVGKYWYLFTEYEYCLAYKNNPNKEYTIFKPNFREWYADPIPFQWKGIQYVFVESYDKIKRQGYISVTWVDKNGKLVRPLKIISEEFHMSFPNVFEYKNEIYMIPECSESKQIRIYKMKEAITHWELYLAFNTENAVVDIGIYQTKDELLLVGSYVKHQYINQSAMICYELKQLENTDNVVFRKCWQEENFSYGVRNAGNFFTMDGKTYRVVQYSTRTVYGKFVSVKEIIKLDKNGIDEIHIQKFDATKLMIRLPAFIYRIWGIHTYGRCGTFEIVDVLVQRFSIGGLLIKILRRVYNKVEVEDES